MDEQDPGHCHLQDNGVRCWIAPHDLPIGAKILDGLDAAIRLHEKVLLILSEHSIRSDWVEDEVTKGFRRREKAQPDRAVSSPSRRCRRGYQRGLGSEATRAAAYRRLPALERSRRLHEELPARAARPQACHSVVV